MKKLVSGLSVILLALSVAPAEAATGASPDSANYCSDSLSGYLPATNGGSLLCDVYSTVKSGSGHSNVMLATEAQGKIFFAATSDEFGEELWVTQGTAGTTKLVKDINPGTAGSSISDMIAYEDRIYFFADNGVNGRELWESNGTAAGTRLVADIMTGSTSSSPEEFVRIMDHIYFNARSGSEGREIMQLDPRTNNVVRIVVQSGQADGVRSGSEMVNYDNLLWFVGDRGSGDRLYSLLLSSTGATGGFQTRSDSIPYELETTLDGTMLFARFNKPLEGSEVYVYKKSGSLIVPTLLEMGAGADGIDPFYLTAFDDGIAFSAMSPFGDGQELWVSQGTVSSTKMVSDVSYGEGSSNPRFLVNHYGDIYFTATRGMTNMMMKWNKTMASPVEVGGTHVLRDETNEFLALLGGAAPIASTTKGLMYRGIVGASFGVTTGNSGYEPMIAAGGLSVSDSAPQLNDVPGTTYRSTDRVVLTGSNLHRMDHVNLINLGDCKESGTTCKLEKLSKTQIAITLPKPAADANYRIALVSPWGVSTHGSLTIKNAPTLTTVNSGNAAAAGDSIVLTGTNLDIAHSITIDGTEIVPTNVTATSMTIKVPADLAEGVYSIRMKSLYNSDLYSFINRLTVVDLASLPNGRVATVAMTRGDHVYPGEKIEIWGAKLNEITDVKLGTVDVTVQVVNDNAGRWDDNSYGTITVPPTMRTSGTFDLTYSSGGQSYTYQNAITIDLSITITTVNLGQPAPAGVTVPIQGAKLGTAIRATLNGQEVSIVPSSETELGIVVPAGLAAGSYPVVLTNGFGSSANGTLVIAADAAAPEPLVAVDQEFKVWTKRLNNDEAKMYAKNVVGEGKIVFKLNGVEIAWVRATDANDRKLRVITEGPMTGANYLVRTVDLKEGRNVLEIYQDGERIRRTIYTAD